MIGPFGVRMYNGLPFASAAEKNSIDRVPTLFAAKCVGETNIRYERYLFLDSRQSASEDFEEYLTDLKAIVQRCEYGRMEDELLRDRLLHGIANDAVRKRLLGKSALTFEKCVARRKFFRPRPSKSIKPRLHSTKATFWSARHYISSSLFWRLQALFCWD